MLAPTDNPAAIVWTIIEIAVLLLSPFFPKSMSLLFLIMSQSGPWLIPGADVNSLPGILYTFGMLAYETNNLVALLLLAILAAAGRHQDVAAFRPAGGG